VVVTGANANDGCQAQDALPALVVRPPEPERPAAGAVDERDLPRVTTDGAYNNRPTRGRAKAGGFRLQAPQRGQKARGLGKVRNAVERCHNFFAQFGRVFRRFDRKARHYLAWLEMAACVILLRSGFVS
jgi:transposase